MPASGRDGPGAAEWVPAHPRSVAQLEEAAQACRGCELFRDATQAVMGEGPLGAELLLLGEQPGDREDVEGRPFVGPAGRLLDRALDEAGVAQQRVYRTNAVKHFRYDRRDSKRIHKSPSRWHVAACEPWLLGELELIAPRGVVVLGATAGQALYGPAFRVGKERGRRLEWPADRWALRQPPEFVVATAHPSSVLRSRQRDADLEALVADLVVARELLG